MAAAAAIGPLALALSHAAFILRDFCCQSAHPSWRTGVIVLARRALSLYLPLSISASCAAAVANLIAIFPALSSKDK